VAGNTVVGALSQASIPRFALLYINKDLPAFGLLIRKMVLIGCALAAAGLLLVALAGQPLLRLLYTEEYAEHQSLFLWLMAAGGLGYIASLLGAPVTAMRLFGIQLKIHLIAILVNILASVVLVKSFGLLGGAAAMTMNAACLIVGYGTVLLRSLRHQ
jgi:O-antigen/teichoic acid export membrane protein